MLMLVGTVRWLLISDTSQELDPSVFFLVSFLLLVKAIKAPCSFYRVLQVVANYYRKWCIDTGNNLSSLRRGGTGGPILLAVLLSILHFTPCRYCKSAIYCKINGKKMFIRGSHFCGCQFFVNRQLSNVIFCMGLPPLIWKCFFHIWTSFFFNFRMSLWSCWHTVFAKKQNSGFKGVIVLNKKFFNTGCC